MKRFIFLSVLLMIFSEIAWAEPNEVFLLKEKFQKMVCPRVKLTVSQDYQKMLASEAIQKLKKVNVTEDQYFVFVDRNPQKQLIFVLFLDIQNENIIEIGRDLVSTGNPKRGKDYFLTPTGIFENSINNFGYRALGTKNKKGWRGLGKKGARVWDFGWQKTEKIINGSKKEFLIRLLMHATDPQFGEPRLGNINSKGCIRISGQMNEFLDLFGILDKEYEENRNKKSIWLLRKDRKTVKYPGKYLIVADSSSF